MFITLGQARIALADFAGRAGKCASSDDVRLFVLSAVERSLLKGAHGNERKWTFQVDGGSFTAPPDMQVALKVKIDGTPDRVWSRWYEFQDIHAADLCDKSYKTGLSEEVGPFFTVYELPPGGARIAAVPLSTEDPSASITIQGIDVNGHEVYTKIGGRLLHGEKIRISRECPVYTKTVFSKVTGIEKTLTSNYVRLYWQVHDPKTEKPLVRGMLGEYRPTDTHPSFRRFRVPMASRDKCTQVSVIGRVAILPSYHDNDVLPVTSLSVLRQMAQTMNAEVNSKLESAVYFDKSVDAIILDENEYNRTGQETLDFNFELSPGANENLQ